MILCGQHVCARPARYRFVWPGQPEAYICEGCVPQLRAIADALGMATMPIIDMDSPEERMLRAARRLKESAGP